VSSSHKRFDRLRPARDLLDLIQHQPRARLAASAAARRAACHCCSIHSGPRTLARPHWRCALAGRHLDDLLHQCGLRYLPRPRHHLHVAAWFGQALGEGGSLWALIGHREALPVYSMA